MSNILCRWLNDELRLSQVVDPKTFAKDFCSGYLIGEILHKYQLQNDFRMFIKKETPISKLNNVNRLEPTLRLLGISFEKNTAKELMQQKQGAATHLLCELYLSLQKKKKNQIGRTVMKVMQPAASASTHKKERDISEPLHRVVKQDEFKLPKISQHYEEKLQPLIDRSAMCHPIQPKRQPKDQDVHRMKNIEKPLHRVVKQDEFKLPKISQQYEEKLQPLNDRSAMCHPIQPKRQPKDQDVHRMKNIEKPLHRVVKQDEFKLPKISQHYEEKLQPLIDRSAMYHPIQPKRQPKDQDVHRMKNIEKPLHRVVKQDEFKLPKISQHYEEKLQPLIDRSAMYHPIQPKRQPKDQDVHRMKNIEKAAIVQVIKPPPCTSKLNLKRRRHQQQQEAQTVQTEIAQFETNRKKLVSRGFTSSSSDKPSPGDLSHGGCRQSCDIPRSAAEIVLKSSSRYILDIQQRSRENVVAREQREKRHERFLAEQLKAHKAQEEALREEQLVKRLTHQTEQEQRLAAQLLQIRSQKELMRQNRLFREQQYQQRRERDFQEALEKEAALAQQVKWERAEEIRKELEFSNRIAAERAQSKNKKHSVICKDILEQIVDLATKVGEHRLLTGNLIPEKLMREWKELLFSGLPLYEPSKGQPGSEFSTPTDPVELKKQEIFNNQDYDEYTNMVGDWAWPEEAGETKSPPTNNNSLGHVIGRLRSVVHQPSMENSVPSFPPFTLKACVLGKFCSGKSTCLAKIAKGLGIYVLSADTLIEDALNAYHNREEPSARAIQGATVEKELRRGNTIPNELLVDIITEAIRQIPAQSGWILDGFPLDITQAHLLEKALGGAVDGGTAVVNNTTNLAADPNPPKPPPPPAPVLDLALLLDVPDECVVRRAFSHTDTDSAAASSCSSDKTLYLAQIQHRISAFQDTWPKLQKWFGGQQNILARVDADVEEEEVYKRVESVLQQVMMKREEALAPCPVEDVALNSQKAPDSSSSTTPPPVDQPPHLKDEASGLTGSHSSLNDDKAQGHSRKVSTSSMTHEDIQEVHTNPSESASPCPGSSSWVYVDEPIPPEIPEYLCSHWNTVCDSYVINIKAVMQQLRSQSTAINRHLYDSREEYKLYLERPDLKQEFVSQWQRHFNSFADDMRDDKEAKAELHLRLDELCERLWDISEKRKEQDEQERAALMGEVWLEDHTAVLISHHSILMQVEFDRFQATLCILRAYYLSMYNQVLPEQHSKLACIPLLKAPEVEDQDTSTEPMGPSVNDKKDKRKMSLRPDSAGGVSERKGQGQTEPVKPPHEKLNFDYEEIFTRISELVSAEVQQMETKEQKEGIQEKEPSKASRSAKKTRREKKTRKGQPSPHPAPSPAPANDKNSDKSRDQEVKNKIHKEYAAALAHEENAAKVRIALVKSHGLMMVHSLQSRAEQTLSNMQKWLEAHYLAEMKSIDQLSEVVRHHIETGAKLQNELVLESTDFYVNGGYQMVASPLPPPRPSPLEKPMQSTLTITQLESLHRQLCMVAPSGLMSSLEFSTLLRDIISVNMGNALPEPWTNKTETQVLEIVSLLKDDCDLIDWRRFLLSAALPWPFPSLTQLLVVLQRFKTADCGDTGYINQEQYLQTELWFSSDSVQPVPEDPSEPLPYDRLANLRKFFFKLFADQSFSPPRLEYTSMLQYFAADPHPSQGFIRALSVVLGQQLKLSSSGHLVKSMPTIEEATELYSSEHGSEHKEKETPCVSTISEREQEVSIPALLDVICHKVTKMKDDSPLPPGCLSQEEHTEHLVQIFKELGYEPEDHVPISILSQHPFIQGLMETTAHYQLVDIHRVILSHQDDGEPNSLTLS